MASQIPFFSSGHLFTHTEAVRRFETDNQAPLKGVYQPSIKFDTNNHQCKCKTALLVFVQGLETEPDLRSR